jgi:hypothetical protein
MPETHRLADVGFHEGELAVQHRAGVEPQAARLARMLDPVELDGGIARFLADRTFAALTGRDHAGRLWVTPLAGLPGLLNVTSLTTLGVGAAPPIGDPLQGLPAGQQVGMVVVEFAARSAAATPPTGAAHQGSSVSTAISCGGPMLLAAHALAAGPLAASQPGFTILDPLTASLLGVFLFGEHIRTGAGALAGEALALAVVIAGAATLSRSLLLDDDNPDPPCPAPPALASVASPPRGLPVTVGRP